MRSLMKPYRGTRINPAHPFALGAKYWFLFNEHIGEFSTNLIRTQDQVIIGEELNGWQGGGYYFDTSLVRYAYLNNFNVESNTLSISFSFKFNEASAPDADIIFELGTNYNPLQDAFIIDAQASIIEVGVQDAGYFTKSFPRPTDGLHHVYTIIFDKRTATNPNTITAYIDGKLQTLSTVGSGGAGTNNFGNYTLYIGARAGSSLYITGLLGWCCFHNRILSDAEVKFLHKYPFDAFVTPTPKAFSISGIIAGTTCWGHSTGVTETNTRAFTNNWTGTGSITESGDAEQLEILGGQYMESEVVNTNGVQTVTIQLNKYGSGDSCTVKYRTGATSDLSAVSWSTYSAPFESSGYIQVRLEEA